jgi:hypothetical protein
MEKIIYITYQTPTIDKGVIERVSLAQKTVDEENEIYKNWIIKREFDLKRDSTSIGDISLPFVRDMIEIGMNEAEDDDIVVISNADILLIPKITEKIINICKNLGSLYSHRYDFEKIEKLLETENEITQGKKYLGCDFFAFSKKWWVSNEHLFPDMVLGREAWDMIYRRAIKENGGGELDRSTYHIMHESPWAINREAPGNSHNLVLADNWTCKYGGNLFGK